MTCREISCNSSLMSPFFTSLKPVVYPFHWQQKYSTQCWNHHFNWSFWVLIRKWNKDFPRQLGTMMGYGEDWISPKTLASAAISIRNLGFLISFCFAFMYCKYPKKKHVVSYMFMKALPSIPNIYNISSISSINFNPFKNKPSQGKKKKLHQPYQPGLTLLGWDPNFGGLGGASPMSCTSSSSWEPQGNFGWGLKADGWRKFMALMVFLWMVLSLSVFRRSINTWSTDNHIVLYLYSIFKCYATQKYSKQSCFGKCLVS